MGGVWSDLVDIGRAMGVGLSGAGSLLHVLWISTGDVYGTSSSSTYYQIVLKYKKILLCLCLYKFLGQQLLIAMNSSKTRMSNCLLAVTK